MDVFRKLQTTHVLVHFHENNYCGTTTYDNTTVPNVFECTSYTKNTDNIPSILDSPNVPF